MLALGHAGKPTHCAMTCSSKFMALVHPDGRDDFFSGASGARFQVFRCTTCFPAIVRGTGDSDDEEPEGSDGGGQGTDALCCSSECCCRASGAVGDSGPACGALPSLAGDASTLVNLPWGAVGMMVGACVTLCVRWVTIDC